jgi:hypothetical protein
LVVPKAVFTIGKEAANDHACRRIYLDGFGQVFAAKLGIKLGLAVISADQETVGGTCIAGKLSKIAISS